MASAALAFSARVTRVGINYCVDVPAKVSRALGARGAVPVVGTVGGTTEVRTTLVPRGGGRHRMFLNGAARAHAGVGEGDRVHVSITRDEAPRAIEPPAELFQALREARALEAFEGFPSGKRNEILRWIDAAVREETRAKRIARAVEEALATREKAADRCTE